MMVKIKYLHIMFIFFNIIGFSLEDVITSILSINYIFVIINYININMFQSEVNSFPIFLTNFFS